jgi:3-methyladenine DNA glycosylase AlkC
MNFLQLIYDRFYDVHSVKEIGTLRNLKEKLKRNSVTSDVNKAFDAHCAFLYSIVRAYVITVILQYFKMNSIEDSPKKNVATNLSEADAKQLFKDNMANVVQQFVTREPGTVIG